MDDIFQKKIHEMHLKEDTEIGQWFLQEICTLPEPLRDWKKWFGLKRKVGFYTQFMMRWNTDVRIAWPHSKDLLQYGLTPSVFVETVHGLELLMNRFIRMSKRPRELWWPGNHEVLEELVRQYEAGEPPTLCIANYQCSYKGTLPPDMVCSEFCSTPGFLPSLKAGMLEWFLAVLPERPHLIPGYTVTRRSEDSILIRLTV